MASGKSAGTRRRRATEADINISGVGIWDQRLRDGDPGEIAEAAAELDALGYAGLWIYDVGGDVFGALRTLLSATRTATVGTSILNLWMHPAAEVATKRAALAAEHPDRLVLGIGVSHAPVVDAKEPGRYQKPIQAMGDYLDALDGAEAPVPKGERMLAALGPKMLEVAAERSLGALPYHQTPEHTARARQALGAGRLLAPEQPVLLETDPARAREAARQSLAPYRRLPNYVNAWRKLGFGDDDFRDGGSDRWIDALVAWGDEDAIVRRVQEHRDAGADHVCIQAIAPDLAAARATYRTLRPALRAIAG